MKELEEKLLELKSQNISYTDLEILDEINYQSEYYLEIELSKEDKEIIFHKIHDAWLKSEGLPIHVITTTVMDNIEKIKNMSVRELIDESCWRY